MSIYFRQNYTQASSFNAANPWVVLDGVEQAIKAKIESSGKILKDWDVKIYRGILTGFNEAFIIDTATKDKLIADSPKAAEIIRPILRGRDIKRYSSDFPDLWVILAGFGSYEYLENDYPTIYNHLVEFKSKLEERGQCRYSSSGKINLDKAYPGQHHWLELDNNPSSEYLSLFEKSKIAWGNLSLGAQFSYIEQGYCVSAPAVFISTDNLYILALLNSKVAEYYIKKLGVSRSGGYIEYKPMFIEKLPVPQVDKEEQEIFKELVQTILTNKKMGASSSEAENKIDELVFKLYDLNDEQAMLIKQDLYRA